MQKAIRFGIPVLVMSGILAFSYIVPVAGLNAVPSVTTGYVIHNCGEAHEMPGYTQQHDHGKLCPHSGLQGQKFIVSGSGFSPGETIKIRFGTVSLTSVRADATGAFSRTETVPSVTAGTYQVTIAGTASSQLIAIFTVT